jgi:hypothetical protein
VTIDIDGELGIWTVYHQPEQPTHHYRARLFVMDKATEHVLLADSLADIRTMIDAVHPGLYRLPRNPADAPEIVECWL